jgi:undecaprenyl-diphosphatase
MNIFQAAVLGVVQGITECLPISSSAHLRVVPALLGWADPGAAYSAVIQLGSVIAIIAYFFNDLWTIAQGSLKCLQSKDYMSRDFRLASAIVIGTIPICILGLIFKKMLEAPDSPFRALSVIGFAAIGIAILLLIAEKVGKRQRTLENLGANDGLLVGLGQCLALIPGSSRSGSALSIALLLNLTREDAARFSFLLGIPAITLAGLVEMKHMFEQGLTQGDIINMVVGLVVSLIVSYATIAWLLRYLLKHSTWLFIIYRLIFGVSILYLSFNGLIH